MGLQFFYEIRLRGCFDRSPIDPRPGERPRDAGRPFGHGAALWATAASLCLLAWGTLGAANGQLWAGGDAQGEEMVLVAHLEGALTHASADRLRRDLSDVRSRWPKAAFVILAIDSREGDISAAEDVVDVVLEGIPGVRTVAWVPPNGEARGGAAAIALAAQEVVLGKGARIGAEPGSPPIPAADAAHLQALMRKAAGKRGYKTALTDAMASGEHEKLILVRLREGASGERKLLQTQSDFDTAAKEERDRRLGEPRVVAERGQTLEMDAEKALEYGFVKHTANDKVELRLALGIAVGDENVIELGESPSVTVVDFLNKPVPRFILLLVGCLALLIELKTFGLMLPGTIALVCFSTFFISCLLPVTGAAEGTASWWEVLLFLVGASLMGLEFILAPGVAIFAIAGAALCAVSIVLAMLPADFSSLPAGTTARDAVVEAMAILGYGFMAGFVCFLGVARFLTKSPFLSRRGFVTRSAILGVPTADSALAAQAAQASLIGKVGLTITELRPAGKVEVDGGQILDVVTQGEFIERGTKVKVIACEGGGVTTVARVEA